MSLRAHTAALLLLALSGCDSASSYPFIGSWALENPRAPNVGLCGFIPTIRISRAHVIVPLDVLTITDVKSDQGRWIISATGSGAPGPPIVIKDVTSQSLVVTNAVGMFACKMKKVGECRNLLCD